MDQVFYANVSCNQFELVPHKFDHYEHEGSTFKISSPKAGEIKINILIDLIKANVGDYYNSCKTLKWNEDEKKKELRTISARYLVVTDEIGNHAGFTMFKFVKDHSRAVLYCYELHIVEKYRRKGLGKHLMNCMEILAKCFEMELIVLTALTNNKMALKFYEEIGFTLDETDPDCEDYKILSKKIK